MLSEKSQRKTNTTKSHLCGIFEKKKRGERGGGEGRGEEGEERQEGEEGEEEEGEGEGEERLKLTEWWLPGAGGGGNGQMLVKG